LLQNWSHGEGGKHSLMSKKYKYVQAQYIIIHTLIPLAHCEPVQPTAQVHLFGAEHVPPFWQPLLQIAVIIISERLHNIKCVSNLNVYLRWQFGGDPL